MKRLFLLNVFFALVFLSCSNNSKLGYDLQSKEMIKLGGYVQGTYYAISYYDSLNRDFNSDIVALLKNFDGSCSIYDSNSVISKINDNRSSEVDETVSHVVRTSLLISKETDGAFDITVGPIADLWGFGAKQGKDVTDLEIQKVLPLVGYDKVQLEGSHLKKTDPKMYLNLNAIAQGFSVDLVGDFLDSKGVKSYLIDIGGEVKAKGRKADHKLWVIGIEKPTATDDDAREVQQLVELENMSIATSGNYRKYYEKNGVRYAHTIDPHSGYPVNHSLLSVSVITKGCMEADAYATAFMVMGLEKALRFLNQHPDLHAYFIYFEDGRNKVCYTSGFEKFLKN